MRKLMNILKILFVLVLLLSVLLMYGYLKFELEKVYGEDFRLFQDWRSFVAFLLSKIPFLGERIEYKPMKVMSPKEYYSSVLRDYVKTYDEKLSEVLKREEEVEKKEKVLKMEESVLANLKEEWQKKREELAVKEKNLEEYEKKIEDITKILLEADPEELSTMMNSEKLSPVTLAVILKKVPPDVSAEFLQALTKINPEKAASVVKEMVSVEKIEENLKNLLEETKRNLEDLIRKEGELFDKKKYLEVVAGVLKDMEDTLIVDFLKVLKIDAETFRLLLTKLPQDRAEEILKIVYRDYPELLGGAKP
ncbi:MAG: hypothetical protein DRP24_02170 [Thermotoga sp.]|nr:MAG: hypothetical protein DRP24_02170 [Thermotoga sp.]